MKRSRLSGGKKTELNRFIQIGILSLFGALLCFRLEAQIRGPLVVNDRWPECTDLLTWADDIFRIDGVSNASERDKAISFHSWLRLFNRLCKNVGGMSHAVEGS